MGKFPRMILLCALLATSSLVGCSEGEDETPLPLLTFEPVATIVVSGECSDISELESWLQAADFRVEAFTTFIVESEGKRPNELRSELIQMAGTLSSVGETPVVDCAVALNEQLRQAMTTTVTLYQDYVNFQRDDLSTIRQQSAAEFEPVQMGIEELKQELDSRLREMSGS